MKTILSKLGSRKLWVSIGAVVGCILTAICGEPEDSTQIVSIVGAVISALGYVISEAVVDKAAVKVAKDDTKTE